MDFKFSSSSAASVGSFVREILEEGAPRWMPRQTEGSSRLSLNTDRDPPLPFGLLIATRTLPSAAFLDSDISIISASAQAFVDIVYLLPPAFSHGFQHIRHYARHAQQTRRRTWSVAVPRQSVQHPSTETRLHGIPPERDVRHVDAFCESPEAGKT